jgi:fluoride exporter
VTPLLVALGAAAGAPLRYWLSLRFDSDDYPGGTWLANTAGSTVLGLVVGLGADGGALALLGTGFCGALTTYSAFALQTVDRGHRGPSYAVLTVVSALAGCALGFWVGTQA